MLLGLGLEAQYFKVGKYGLASVKATPSSDWSGGFDGHLDPTATGQRADGTSFHLIIWLDETIRQMPIEPLGHAAHYF